MRTHLLSSCRARTTVRRLVVALTVGSSTACLRNPSADAATAQALTEIAAQLGDIQQDNAALQNQIDSLRAVVARQDTVLRRVANLAGVSMAP